MKEIALQFRDNIFYPFSDEDKESAREFRDNQIVNAKISGVQKERSYLQLKMFFAVCRKVADNTQDPNWDTTEKVLEQVKIKCRYIKEHIIVGKAVHIITGSISYKALPHMQACNFFDRGYIEMAKHLGVRVDKLLESMGDIE